MKALYGCSLSQMGVCGASCAHPYCECDAVNTTALPCSPIGTGPLTALEGDIDPVTGAQQFWTPSDDVGYVNALDTPWWQYQFGFVGLTFGSGEFTTTHVPHYCDYITSQPGACESLVEGLFPAVTLAESGLCDAACGACQPPNDYTGCTPTSGCNTCISAVATAVSYVQGNCSSTTSTGFTCQRSGCAQSIAFARQTVNTCPALPAEFWDAHQFVSNYDTLVNAEMSCTTDSCLHQYHMVEQGCYGSNFASTCRQDTSESNACLDAIDVLEPLNCTGQSLFTAATGLPASTLSAYKGNALLQCVPAVRSCAPNAFEDACLTCSDECRTVAVAYKNTLDTNIHDCAQFITQAGLNYDDLYAAATAATTAGCSGDVAAQSCQNTFTDAITTCNEAGVDLYGPSRCSDAQCMAKALILRAVHDDCLAASPGTWETTLTATAYDSLSSVDCGCVDHDLSSVSDNNDGWSCSQLAANGKCTYDMGALIRSLDGTFVHQICCDSCARDTRCEDQAECATIGDDYDVTFPSACQHPMADFDPAQTHGNLIAYMCPRSCNSCLTRFDECLSAPCLHGGTCIEGIHSFSCNCTVGWQGDTCQLLADPCDEVPCGGHGVCTATGPLTYSCSCFDGFSGDNCDTLGADCDSNPCQNSGICMEAGFIPRPYQELASGTCGIDTAYTYQFVDITRTGTPVETWQGDADNGFYTVSLAGYFGGNRISWYGSTYESISISANGYLVFGVSDYTGSDTQPLPNMDALVSPILAPFWVDLDPGNSNGPASGVYFAKYESDKFIVEWSDMEYAGATVDSVYVTFEAILFPFSGDVVLVYGHMDPTSVSDSTPSIGFMGHGGVAGHQIFYGVVPNASTSVLVPAACHLEVGYACSCVDGWIGDNCAEEQRPCEEGNKCLPDNGEQCVGGDAGGYTCECAADYHTTETLLNASDVCPLVSDNTGVGSGWTSTSVRGSLSIDVATDMGAPTTYVVTLRADSSDGPAITAGPIVATDNGFTMTAWQRDLTPALASEAGLHVTWMGISADLACSERGGRTEPGHGWRITPVSAFQACNLGLSGTTTDLSSCMTVVYTASLYINTSAAGFTETPVYTASLGAQTDPGVKITGAGAVYSPTADGFTVYLKWTMDSESPDADTLAEDNGFYINWIGVPEGFSSSGLSAGYSGTSGWSPGTDGVYIDVDTTVAGWPAANYILYMSSLQAPSDPIWPVDGAATAIAASGTGFRVALSQGDNSTTESSPAPPTTPPAQPSCVDSCTAAELADCSALASVFLEPSGCGYSCLQNDPETILEAQQRCGESGRRRAQDTAAPGALSMAIFATVNSYRIGWIGMLSRCAQVDNCAPDLNPCTNGGVCSDVGLYATCECPSDFTGDFCQLAIDACFSGPCANGGVCIQGNVPQCYDQGCYRDGTFTRTAYSMFKFNLDPADDQTGLRGELASFVQLSEFALYGPGGVRISRGSVENTEGLGPVDDECGQHACQIDANGTLFGIAAPGLAIDNVVQCSSCVVDRWLDFTMGDLVMTFSSPVTVHSYDWATAGDPIQADPAKWTLEGSLDGSSWTVVDSSFQSMPLVPSIDRYTWQGPFSVDAVSYTPYMCDCATGFMGPNCVDDIDECEVSPCGNGGICIEGPGYGTYTCSCPAGWMPPNCLSALTGPSSPCDGLYFCAGDTNLDGDVNVYDLLGFLAAFGIDMHPDDCVCPGSGSCKYDFNRDFSVNTDDLLQLFSEYWGRSYDASIDESAVPRFRCPW
eukprot:SAG31_NODE_1940_length_6860_cov_4.116540_1_plen_1746_part_10